MKSINASQIKGESFNMISVVEEAIEITPNDLETAVKEMKKLVSDLVTLDEALFFKKEKLAKKISNTTNSKQEDLVKEIEKKLKCIKLEPLGNAKNILEKNRNILELKNIQKILRYAIEIESEDCKKVLETLMSSDLKEDWEFMCTLLYYYLKYGPERTNTYGEEFRTILMHYSKQIEDKMSNLFVNSLEQENITECRAAFQSLEQLGKEEIIYEKYFNTFDVFSKDIQISPPKINTVDFENFSIPNNEFLTLLNEVVSTITENSEISLRIFNKSFSKCFTEKIYHNVIFKAVEQFMAVEDPIVYLFTLSHVHNSLIANISTIHNISTNEVSSESNVYLQETFSQYFIKSIQKEKEAFDKIYSILIDHKITDMNYIILGERIPVKNDSLENSFLILLYVIHQFLLRSKNYSESDSSEILKYEFRKMTFLIDKIVILQKSRISTICKLSNIYLITKKYLRQKFYLVETFIAKINDSIQTLFNDQINYVNLIVKGKINNLYFLDKNDYKKILDFLKDSIREAEVLKGRNYTIFTDRILTYTYNRLIKQIYTIVYNKKQSANLLGVIDEILGYVIFINRTNMVHKFTYIKNVCRLISVEKERFVEVYKELEGMIPEKEIKNLLKCRTDREEIKAKIFAISK